jgi:hypothetical protein
MSSQYLVVHTPGAFGNFIAYLIDCYQSNKLLPSPFVGVGVSHNRQVLTKSIDLVIPGMWENYNNGSNEKKVIGCVWKQSFFTYILHAYYSRTIVGQYGKCGLEYAEKNFYSFVKEHKGTERVMQNIIDLKDLFGLCIDEKNPQVPRHILRMFFWFNIFKNKDNIVSITNNRIKNLVGIQLLDIEDIIDYTKLKSFMQKEFLIDLDFSDLHAEFLKKNRSLNEYIRAKSIVDAVKNNQLVDTRNLSIVSEASILYELEKFYFDIPFFNFIHFFENTKEIIEYVKYFPNFMKQPNKIYKHYYEMFPDPKKTKII